jgi:hypothetical protein
MKAIIQSFIVVIVLGCATANCEDAPKKVSIAPKNDLSAIAVADPLGRGFGSSVCGSNLSKEYQEGNRIGTKNDHYGTRNKLVIDDGKSAFPATDKETGLPIIVLTEAKLTKELQDLVRGYNSAMQSAFEQRKKRTEQAAP